MNSEARNSAAKSFGLRTSPNWVSKTTQFWGGAGSRYMTFVVKHASAANARVGFGQVIMRLGSSAVKARPNQAVPGKSTPVAVSGLATPIIPNGGTRGNAIAMAGGAGKHHGNAKSRLAVIQSTRRKGAAPAWYSRMPEGITG